MTILGTHTKTADNYKDFFAGLLPKDQELKDSAIQISTKRAFLVIDEKDAGETVQVCQFTKDTEKQTVTVKDVRKVSRLMKNLPKKITAALDRIRDAKKPTPRIKITPERILELAKMVHKRLDQKNTKVVLRPAMSNGKPVNLFIDVYYTKKKDNQGNMLKITSGPDAKLAFASDGNYDRWFKKVDAGLKVIEAKLEKRLIKLQKGSAKVSLKEGMVSVSGNIDDVIEAIKEAKKQ